ncbi:MAG: LrgB family protein [Bacteroidales bacterium]|nr:LrgB family protein [Bacteroidales bacterium]
MKNIINSEPVILALTIFCFLLGTLINKKYSKPYTSPILLAIIFLIPLLLVLDIDYPTYEKGTHVITFLLAPTVVALGYNMHKQSKSIKKNIVPILITVFIGSLVGVLSVIGICKLFNAPMEIMTAMEPKSVTMPIALGISERSHGILSLTAVSVAICGILGSVIGPWLLEKIKVKSPVAKGLAMGAASHGIGTARAMEMGPVEGAVAGMAIGIMGIFTSIIIPIIEKLM